MLVFFVCVSRSELWRLSPGPQRHHREPWVPARVPQLCQLHMDCADRGAQPHPAVLPGLRAGGGLRHPGRLRWAAAAGKPESQVGWRSWPGLGALGDLRPGT